MVNNRKSTLFAAIFFIAIGRIYAIELVDQNATSELNNIERGSSDIRAQMAQKNRAAKISDEMILTCSGANDDASAVQTLLDRGAEVDYEGSDGETCLMRAARFGHSRIVALLLSRRARVDLQDRVPIWGYTALHWAARNGYVEIVKKLVKSGADINFPSRKTISLPWGASPGAEFLIGNANALHFAIAESRDSAMLKTLLAYKKLDVNFPDSEGRTPLMMAAAVGEENVIRSLVDRGASLSIRDNQSNTVCDYVRQFTGHSLYVSQASYDQIGQYLASKGGCN